MSINPWPLTAHRPDGEMIPMQRIFVGLRTVLEDGCAFYDSYPPLQPGDYLMRDGVKLLTES